MRKSLLGVILTFLLVQSGLAQDTVHLKQIARQNTIITDRPPQAVYFQIGGSGPILSANYDRRFLNRVNGLGFAVGFGYWREDDFFGASMSYVSIPVSINYLIGRKNHFLELAAGTTFVSAKGSDWFDEPSSGSGFIHHINMGYRHQPTTGGFFFRGGFSPLFAAGEYATSFYLGFGYNF